MEVKKVANILEATEELKKGNSVEVQCFGQSMHPVLRNGAYVTIEPRDEYTVAEAVCCLIEHPTFGAYIVDGHFIYDFNNEGQALIGDIQGNMDGFASHIFGKITKARYES